MKTHVLQVTEVYIDIKDTEQKELIIHTKAMINGPSYENGFLVPRKYAKAPKNGIFSFDLLTNSPNKSKSDIMTEIEILPFHWTNYPGNIKAVKVIASNNFEVKFINEDDGLKHDSTSKTSISQLIQKTNISQNSDIEFYLFNHAFLSE